MMMTYYLLESKYTFEVLLFLKSLRYPPSESCILHVYHSGMSHKLEARVNAVAVVYEM